MHVDAQAPGAGLGDREAAGQHAAHLADHGIAEAARRDPGLRLGINVTGGTVTHPAVAEAVGVDHTPVEDVLGSKQKV